MTARDVENAMLDRCVAVARDATLAVQNQHEANVFRLASMVIQTRYETEAINLMRASDLYFASHPDERVEPADVVRNGWIVNLPRLRDRLSRLLGWRY